MSVLTAIPKVFGGIASLAIVSFFYILGIVLALFLKALGIFLLLAIIYAISAFFGIVPPVDYVPIIPMV